MNRVHLLTGFGLLAIACTAQADQDERKSPFAGLDLDENGAVNFQEFMAGELPSFARLDSDENGVLTLDEFLNGRGSIADRPSRKDEEDSRAERQAQMGQRAEERFVQMDLDGNEMVSAAEFREATFQQMDRDNDGQLTVQEMRPPRGPGGRGHGRRGGDGAPEQNL